MAWYEAGQRWSDRRSWLPGYVRDARFDADSATRLEILRKARYFERNNGFVNRLADLFEEYTVGPEGLRMVPVSSNEEWNKKAAEWWAGWCRFPDVSTLMPFGTVQSLMARSWFIDGEIFLIKTRGRERQDQASYPRIELIEGHRVESNPSFAADDYYQDGIEIDTNGRPKGYWVRRGLTTDTVHSLYPADQVLHLFEPSRPGQLRGISMLYPVMNDLHDLDDLSMLEMDAAKDAAATTNIIKTKTGEVSFDDLRRARFAGQGTKANSGGSDNVRTEYYNDVFKGRAKVMRHGDDFDQFVSSRPSVATQAYWEYLLSKVCCGVGISKLLVMPYSMQGTVTRADLDVAATFFRSRSAVMSAVVREIYVYVMGWATNNVRELSDPPFDWAKVEARPPRSVNVDVGRNSQALISEYVAGWRTLEEICGELGRDYREVLRQRGQERKLARQIEEEMGLTPGELINAALEAIKTQQQQQIQQQQVQPKEAA